MSLRGGYPIEEFLEAITAQLDQTQDALRLKAVNRPLTFALKDFNVDLQVFVEMDAGGRVTFRPAAPNEAGASTVSIGFTTITRSMIEENTISMEMAQAPTLDELGLQSDEQRQLAKIGVRNAAQLRNLQRNAGADTLSRHSGVDLGRIRGALDLARPRLDDIVTEAPHTAVPEPDPPTTPTPEPSVTGPEPRAPWDFEPRRPAPGGDITPTAPGPKPLTPEPAPTPGGPRPEPEPRGGLTDRLRRGLGDAEPVGRQPRRLNIDPGARNIRFEGRNLLEGQRPPSALLDGRRLSLIEANERSVSFALPPGQGGGHLSVELPDGTVEEFDVVLGTDR